MRLKLTWAPATVGRPRATHRSDSAVRRPASGPLTRRGRGRRIPPGGVAGDPHVVGDQHRPGSDRGGPRGRVGLSTDRCPAGAGGTPAGGPRGASARVRRGSTAAPVRSPAHRAKRSLASTTSGRTVARSPSGPTGSAEGDERHHVDGTQSGMDAGVERRSMRATAAVTSSRAASSTDSSGPPRVRTERWCSGSEWTSSTVSTPAALPMASMVDWSRPSLMLMTHSAQCPPSNTSAPAVQCVRRRRRDRSGDGGASGGAHVRTCRPTRRDRPARRGRTRRQASATGHSAQMR